MQHDLVIQQADAARAEPGHSAELVLLFHGVGASARDLLPMGEALAEHRPMAWVVSVQAPDPSDFGRGWQWFSVQGVTEANRPGRVAAAMPAFLQRVAAWQARAGSSELRPEPSLLGLQGNARPGVSA